MEINSEDYYELLGISRDSNIEQIKKAYRKSALRWHPDKNLDHRELAEKNFKRISEAYEVLSDTNKRQIYDRYGKEGLTSGGADVPPGGGFGFPGMADFFGGGFGPFGAGGGVFGFNFRDPNDVFREFFGSSDPFADFFSETSTHTSNGDASSSRSSQSIGGFFDPFSMFGNNMFGVGGTSMHMSTSMMGGPGGANMKRISTSVKTVNGKRVETKRVVDNGVETVTVIENGVVKSKTVNGQPQLTSG